MKHDYKIGDKVVMVDSINDNRVRTVDETPSNDGRFVVLDGHKHQYSTEYIRPASVEEQRTGYRATA